MSLDHPAGKAKISLRMPWYYQYGIEERRKEILEWLETCPGTIDEIAMFTGLGFFPPDLRVVERQVVVLKKVMPMFRALGLPVGINHHMTIGARYEKPGQSLNQPWQKMEGLDGTAGKWYCASDPRMQDYISRLYILLASAGPDFIWMDDDIRLDGAGCFCDLCLERFAGETGRRWTREDLKAAFNHGSIEERLSARKAWLAHNRRSIAEIYVLIRGAVDTVAPSIPLGCMNGEKPYEGFGFAEIAAAMSGTGNLPVKWRPGAGFYGGDVLPGHLLLKGHTIGRVVAFLPPTVTDIQSECECFPSLSQQKSNTMFGLEIGVDIAAGCTGSALNFLPLTSNPIAEYRSRFAWVHARRRFYDRLVTTFGRSPCEGIWSAQTRDHFACELTEDDWLGGNRRYESAIIHALSEIGLPMAYGQEGAAVTILHDDTCLEFSRDELLKMLSGSVWLDGPALTRLNQMGFAEHTGFTVRTTISDDVHELLTSDPLNGDFAGWQYALWEWGGEPITVIAPAADHSRVISEIAEYDVEGNMVSRAKKLGAISGVFENSLGGRVAVTGLHPWGSNPLVVSLLLSLAKSTQFKALTRWLSKEQLPAYIGSFHGKIGLWCRRDGRGRPALFLVNVSLDTAEKVQVMVRDAEPTLTLFRADGSAGQPLARRKQDGVYGQFEIDRLPPWEMVLLRT